MNKRFLLILSLILAIALAGLWWYFFVYTRVVAVELTNVESVTVRDSSRNEVTQLDATSTSIRLPSGQDYTLDYTSVDNYADGSVKLPSDQSTISISPDYSAGYYRSLIDQNTPKVMKLLADKYSSIDQYSIAEQKMYDFGNWFTIILQHKGDYGVYTDDLRVIFEKDGDSWSMATEPDILLDKYDNPDIPYDVLLDTNKL